MQQLTNTEKVQLQSWNTVRLKAQKKTQPGETKNNYVYVFYFNIYFYIS